MLAKSNQNSAPGPDGVSFGVLSKLDGCNHILAKLFIKVLALGTAPHSWGESVVKPIHKKGSPSDPTNFRMIALFHFLLTERMTDYLISNQLIDPTMQKAFLPGINGCIVHNATMEEIVMDAKHKKLTAHMTSFNLKDAFVSISFPHP